MHTYDTIGHVELLLAAYVGLGLSVAGACRTSCFDQVLHIRDASLAVLAIWVVSACARAARSNDLAMLQRLPDKVSCLQQLFSVCGPERCRRLAERFSTQLQEAIRQLF